MKRITIFMMALLMVSATSVQADKIGEWHLDEGTGNITSDSSGYGNHGTIFIAPAGSPPHIHSSGATWIDDGICGSALNFDGYFDWVNFGTGVTNQINSQMPRDYTVTAWIRPSSLPTGRNAAMSFTAMELGQSGGRVYFWQAYTGWGNGYQFMSSPLLEVGEWTHIVGVHRDTAGIDLYVDGIYVGSDNIKSEKYPNASISLDTHAGVWYTANPSHYGSAWFEGDIDEISIYNEALTAEQIAALFAECAAGLEKEITTGPDVDGDGEIDIVVEVGQSETTFYGFTITQSGLDGLLIVDTVSAEWNVVEVVSENPDDDFKMFPAGKGDPAKSAKKIEWRPASSSSSLFVRVKTRQSPGKKNTKFAPGSSGALYLNEDGAAAYEVDENGEPLRDPDTGEKLPPIMVSNPLCLVAVGDINGDGVIVRDGSGDEDGDGLTDLYEVIVTGTDPCNPDTDGDGVTDYVDPDPLDPEVH